MKLKINLAGVLGGLVLLYPLAVFLSVVVFDVKPNHLAFFIVIFGAVYFAMMVTNPAKKKPTMFISPLLLCVIGLTGYFLDTNFMLSLFPNLVDKSKIVVKFYPVLANTAYFIIFVTSLFTPPTLIYDVALLLDKRLKGSAAEKPMMEFSRRASIAWCVFFVLDAAIAAFTVFIPTHIVDSFMVDFAMLLRTDNPQKAADTIWGIYNGAITYVIMCAIFIIQLVIGKRIINRMLRKAPTGD